MASDGPHLAGTCKVCGGGRFWLDGYGRTWCEKCQPPPTEAMVVRRVRRGLELCGCRLSSETWVEKACRYRDRVRVECHRCGRFVGYRMKNSTKGSRKHG